MSIARGSKYESVRNDTLIPFQHGLSDLGLVKELHIGWTSQAYAHGNSNLAWDCFPFVLFFHFIMCS